MKPFIWPWSCYRSCLNSAPDLDYRFGEIEITLSWFSCNGFARSTTLYLFISPWFIFLGFIDNWPRLVRDTDWTFYVQWNFIALFDPEASRLPTRSRHCVCRFFSWNFKTKKKWSSFSIIIRINKGGDYEFLAIADQDIWQRNYSR